MWPETLKARIERELDARSVAMAVWLYRRTRGRITRLWGRRAIVLTTVGRRSGLPRTVIVQAFPDGPAMFVVAANGGLPTPPGWYFNLLAEPRVLAEYEGRRLVLRAEPVDESAAADRWRQVLAVAPDYERYARRKGNIPPIFRLAPEPSATSTPPSEVHAHPAKSPIPPQRRPGLALVAAAVATSAYARPTAHRRCTRRLAWKCSQRRGGRLTSLGRCAGTVLEPAGPLDL